MSHLSRLKKATRKSLRKIGLERIRTPSLIQLLAAERIETVLDVGANVGQFSLELREQGYAGEIISFEPIEPVFRVLQAKAAKDASWDVYNLALGSTEGEMNIHVAEETVFSSLRVPTDYVNREFPASRIVREETIQVTRLDRFMTQRRWGRVMMKVDAQGFEDEVLRGAGDRMSDLTAIQLELPVTPLYEGQKPWTEMVDTLAKSGFSVAMVKENSYDWNTIRLLELDVIFVRSPVKARG